MAISCFRLSISVKSRSAITAPSPDRIGSPVIDSSSAPAARQALWPAHRRSTCSSCSPNRSPEGRQVCDQAACASPPPCLAFDLGSLHDVCAHRFTPKAQLNGFKSIDECVLALQSGRVDAEILAATVLHRSHS
jgi:hypothetical protein